MKQQQGPVAQWLEQGTHNPLVVGSIPTWPTSFLNLKVLEIAVDLIKQVYLHGIKVR